MYIWMVYFSFFRCTTISIVTSGDKCGSYVNIIVFREWPFFYSVVLRNVQYIIYMMIFRKGTAREEGVWGFFFAARRKKNMENFLDLKDEHTQKINILTFQQEICYKFKKNLIFHV